MEHHRGVCRPEEVTERLRLPVVTAARAVVESARIVPYETGVVLADAALHAQLVDGDDLQAAYDSARAWPGSRRAGAALAFADGRAESPGESRVRVLLQQLGLPRPELQAPILDGTGELVARVDFLFPAERTIVEFDGMLKYGLQSGDPGADLFQEKRREDKLRELGYEVVRIVWSDLADPRRVARRILAAFERSRARRNPAARAG